MPPPTPVPTKTPSMLENGRPAPRSSSPLIATLTSLSTSTGTPASSSEIRPQGERVVHARDVGAARDDAFVRAARRADAYRSEGGGVGARCVDGDADRLEDRRGDRLGAVLGRGHARLAHDLVAARHDRLDLRAAQVDARDEAVEIGRLRRHASSAKVCPS